MGEIIVSIVCISYNHENFINECLNSFLMQKTNFKYEVLIHDDASTDNTVKIICEYAEKYPDIIKPIYQTENQYSKGINPAVEYLYPLAQGKYIAICEGDDYWIDPFKLQKQVDFLEENQEYSLCVGGFRKYNILSKEIEDVIYLPKGVEIQQNGYSFLLKDTQKKWFTKTLTGLFRNNSDIFEQIKNYNNSRDVHLYYHLLKEGKGFYFTDIFGVYRIHEGGIHSLELDIIKIMKGYEIYKELYQINKDKYTKHFYLNHIFKLLNHNIYKNEKTNLNNYQIFLEALRLINNPKDCFSLWKIVFPPFLKPMIMKLFN